MAQVNWKLMLLIICSSAAICIAKESFQLFYSEKSNEATVFTSLSNVSGVGRVIDCIVLCYQSIRCLTFRFLPDTLECQMSNEEPGGFGTGVSVFSYGLRRRSAFNRCKRVVASDDGRLFCPIQQRVSGAVRFNQTWSAYEAGFGDDVNFWIGLQTIHQLTSPAGVTFLVEFITWTGSLMRQEYPRFHVAGSGSFYRLSFDPVNVNMSSLVLDRLTEITNGKSFSTWDSNNDPTGLSCSISLHGHSGWWFGGCSRVNPNGIYANASQTGQHVMSWRFNSTWSSLRAIRLMLAR